MENYSKVLVAVDVSDDSLHVLKTAASIIDTKSTQVTVLHVAKHPVAVLGHTSTQSAQINENQIRESLFSFLAQITEKAGLGREAIRIIFGQPVDAIVSKAHQDKSDLIIIGRRGYQGLNLLLGHYANDVLHHAPCDVLAVRIY